MVNIVFVGTRYFNSCCNEDALSLLYRTVYGGALVRETVARILHVEQVRLENKKVPFNK